MSGPFVRRVLVFGLLACAAGTLRGSSPETAVDPASREALSVAVRGILAECLPEKFEIKDDWGDQKARFSQLKIHRDGWKLDFEKKTKDVNHGLWKKVDITPIDPDKQLQFKVVEAKSTGPQSFGFQLFASSPLRVDARIERWRTGVKMFNLSTESTAQVEMILNGTLSFDFATIDGTHTLVLTPRATSVDLRLADLDIHRISKAAGPLVRELGDLVDHPVDNFLDRFEGKITEKLNAAIAKRPEKFRVKLNLPTIDFSGWSWPKSLGGEE
jgi:hypothetical protein